MAQANRSLFALHAKLPPPQLLTLIARQFSVFSPPDFCRPFNPPNSDHPPNPPLRHVHQQAQKAAPPTAFATPDATHFRGGEEKQLTTAPAAPEKTVASVDPLGLDNPAELYARLSSAELAATLMNLELVSRESLVELSSAVLKSPLMKLPPAAAPVNLVVKKTAYSHFCAGATVEEAGAVLQRMWELGLRGILDYGVEDAMDDDTCDRNLAGYLGTVIQTQELPPKSVSHGCVKLTAICPIPLLERVSELLRWKHTHPGYNLPWMARTLPILAPESPIHNQGEPPAELSTEEEAQLARAAERLRNVARACEARGLPLLVDAEYQSVQPAIDYLTYAAALEFNKGQPVVFGTVQAYLKDSYDRLALAVEGASQAGVSYGVKLVRGAYISRESARAKKAGVESPVHSCIEATHTNYNRCARLMLTAAAKGKSDLAHSVVLATHNAGSARVAVQAAHELGLAPSNPQLQFAQLKGMADGLSLGLAKTGHMVSKYLVFGSLQDVVPYLLRRAEENKGLLGNTQADRTRLRSELVRRLRSRIGFASPAKA